jgi:hypothetical protein
MLEVDPFTEEVLDMALESARAYEWVNTPSIASSLTADGMLELCRKAGYSEESSQKAATNQANARMDRDMVP